jgi:hypothetical protein
LNVVEYRYDFDAPLKNGNKIGLSRNPIPAGDSRLMKILSMKADESLRIRIYSFQINENHGIREIFRQFSANAICGNRDDTHG